MNYAYNCFVAISFQINRLGFLKLGLIRANHLKRWDAKPKPKSVLYGYGSWVAGRSL